MADLEAQLIDTGKMQDWTPGSLFKWTLVLES